MNGPRPDSHDRELECQEAMNDRLFAMMNDAVDAGWSEEEISEAVRDLTLAWRHWRREKRATDAQIAAEKARLRQ